MSFLSHASEATKKSPPSLLQLSKKNFSFSTCARASERRAVSLFLLLYAVCSSSKVEPTAAAAAVGGGVLFYSLPLRTYAFSLL